MYVCVCVNVSYKYCQRNDILAGGSNKKKTIENDHVFCPHYTFANNKGNSHFEKDFLFWTDNFRNNFQTAMTILINGQLRI